MSTILQRYSRSQLARAPHVKISSGGCVLFILGLCLFDDLWLKRTWRIKCWGMDRLLGYGYWGSLRIGVILSCGLLPVIHAPGDIIPEDTPYPFPETRRCPASVRRSLTLSRSVDARSIRPITVSRKVA